jgi:hypothetical protein
MACITSVSFAVLINGATSPFFTFEKGLRQGFPLSPLLFLLVAEGLSRAIENAVRSGDFNGIHLTAGLRITHLLFVDDILIFYNGQRRDTKVLENILSLFRSATCMQINFQKSTLSFSEIGKRGRKNLLKALSIYNSRFLRRPKISRFSPKTE